MSLSLIRVVARVIAIPEYTDQVKSILLELVKATREEPGCLQYDLLQNQADPTDFTFVEIWSSVAFLEQHLAAEAIKIASEKLTGLLMGVPDIRRYNYLE